MKKFIAVLMIMLLSLTCFAEGETYATANDLFQHWAEVGFPDYVSGVWSNDGSMNNLTIALVGGEEGERGKEEILAMLGDASVEFVYQTYSRNYLTKVQDELLPYFEKELGLVSSGLDEMNNCITLGISGEKDENPETHAMLSELVEKYGDIFEIEYGVHMVTSDTLVMPLDDVTLIYTEKTDTQYFIFAAICVLLVVTVLALYLKRRNALVRATNAGDITETQPSIKEVEGMIKDAALEVPAELDEKVMRDIESK
ncbi:MAG: hypothetical protein IJN48_04085 [Clostridia bacterium]|nr:hypothetical protein [Clostridia bacterium]